MQAIRLLWDLSGMCRNTVAQICVSPLKLYAIYSPVLQGLKGFNMEINNNTILITGGGSGIGRALAHRFHDLGNFVIVAGRKKDALDETMTGRANMKSYLLDVESPEEIAAFATKVTTAHPDLNVVINNAGIMRFENLGSKRDLADADSTIATNLLGPIRILNALIDHLVAKENAAIINVTSGLAFVPLITTPTYNATKAAIHSYTLSLREQLKGKVEVIELAPPAVQTDLTPGQATREGYLPLEQFINEVMQILQGKPTPTEIIVKNAAFLRWAEKEHRFDATLAALNIPR